MSRNSKPRKQYRPRVNAPLLPVEIAMRRAEWLEAEKGLLKLRDGEPCLHVVAQMCRLIPVAHTVAEALCGDQREAIAVLDGALGLLNGIVCNGYRWDASAAEDLGIAMDVAIQIMGKAPPAAILAAERHVIALAEMSA